MTNTTLNIKGRVWLYTDEGSFLGSGRVELLRRIGEHGSISKAAKTMKMSYKKAWTLVTSMNTQAKEPLVIVFSGGKNGGGSFLSNKGKEYITLFEELKERNNRFLNRELKKISNDSIE